MHQDPDAYVAQIQLFLSIKLNLSLVLRLFSSKYSPRRNEPTLREHNTMAHIFPKPVRLLQTFNSSHNLPKCTRYFTRSASGTSISDPPRDSPPQAATPMPYIVETIVGSLHLRIKQHITNIPGRWMAHLYEASTMSEQLLTLGRRYLLTTAQGTNNMSEWRG
jgi:hypothetical protein